MSTMALQINTVGTWQDVAHFDERSLSRIKIVTVPLAQALPAAQWRIAAGRDRPLFTLSGPYFVWMPVVERPKENRLPSSRRRA